MRPEDEFLYEYAIVRYSPIPERGECVNIGLVMMNKRKKWLKGRIKINPDKLLALFPNADLTTLERQAGLFERTDVPAQDLPTEEKYRWLTAVKSAAIRLSPSHPGIILESREYSDKIMEEEFSRLFSLLVE